MRRWISRCSARTSTRRLRIPMARKTSPKMPPWVIHDLRRTFASGDANLGIKLEVIEKVLNHVSGSQSSSAFAFRSRRRSRMGWRRRGISVAAKLKRGVRRYIPLGLSRGAGVGWGKILISGDEAGSAAIGRADDWIIAQRGDAFQRHVPTLILSSFCSRRIAPIRNPVQKPKVDKAERKSIRSTLLCKTAPRIEYWTNQN